MNRTFLLGAAAFLSAAAAHAQTTGSMTGGGAFNTDYPPEMHKFNIGSGGAGLPPLPPGPSATFSTYFAVGSGQGQLAFLSDDLTCDADSPPYGNGGGCQGPAGGAGNTVSYAASDVAFDAAQIASWATASFGQTAAANLIQLPSMGVGVAIPVDNAATRANGALTLSDDDLCGVFSGAITDFSQIADSVTTPKPGPITVFYSTQEEGPSFWLTAHLAAVCNGNNSAITFAPTTDFASLFAGGVPGNFVPEAGNAAMASAMAGCGGSLPTGLGYLTPDYTTIDPKSQARIGCKLNGSNRSPLVVAGLDVGATPYIPTVANIARGLTSAVLGSDLVPPGNAGAGADPANWAPVVQTVSAGYPIVGYTLLDFAQCYADPTVSAAIPLFLADHYGARHYQSIENANGFVTLKQVAKTKYFATIKNNILANKRGWGDDIGDAAVCGGKKGR